MERIRVGDIEMAYRWDGNDDGPVVMMAHALGSSHRIWDWQVPALADRYHILRYDWRGHGDTDAPPGPYSLAMFIDDAVGLMDALGLDKIHWVGLSTGGMIGQGMGINRPDRLASLTLCNTTSLWDPWYRDFVTERQALIRAQGMSPAWDLTHKLWFTDAFADAANADYQAVREIFIRLPIEGYLGAMSAVAELAYQDQLGRITTPTRIIAAGDDRITPVAHSEIIRDRIEGAELTVLEGQRHFSNVEEPAVFNHALRKGLDAMIRSS